MLETATRLMQAGATPSVSEVAEAAGVSRATAYRYFPSQAALVQAVVDEGLGPILDLALDVSRCRAPRRRPVRHGDAAHRGFRGDVQGGAETVARPMGASARPARSASEPQFTRGHRVDLLEGCDRAAARARLPPREFERLAQALSLVFGVEVLIVLKDIWGLDGRRTRSVAQWAAGALVAAPQWQEQVTEGDGIGRRLQIASIWFDQISWRLDQTRCRSMLHKFCRISSE